MLKANFHRNVHFRPKHSYIPRNKPEVYELLRVHRTEKIRVVGSGHSWSDVAASSSVMISLAKLNQVEAIHVGDNPWVRVQGGCRLKDLIKKLRRNGLTLPTIGQVTEQTIAGAISTATHGSGKPSLSHFVIGVEVAAYDTNRDPTRYRWDQRDHELNAARCGLGCMGVVLAVTLRCVPAYLVCEKVEITDALDDVLAVEADYPLQEFGLIPHTWKYFVFRRRPTEHRPWWRIPHAWWNRATKLLLADIGFHTQLKTVLRFGGSGRWLMRSVPTQLKVVKLISLQGVVVDDSVAVLTRAHHLFRHLEMEIFVPADTVRDAVRTIQYATAVFAGSQDDDASARERIADKGQYERLCDLRGSYVHHYPIYFRRVDPEDSLLSMTSGSNKPWYAIGFFTYYAADSESFGAYRQYALFMARILVSLFGARLHWGKYFPLDSNSVNWQYNGLKEFRELCREVDPGGVFRNEYTSRVLGFDNERESQGVSVTDNVQRNTTL